jgi:NADH-dependent peroxiredoxin subunit F
MLEAELKSQLGAYLTRLVTPVHITAYVDASAESRDMLALLTDIRELSDKVTITHKRGDKGGEAGGQTEGGVPRYPSFSLARPDESARVHFAGIPVGHEFTSLVLALLQVGGVAPKLDAAVIEQIRNLEGEYDFTTYISLTCQNCPDVVQALNAMAVINPGIRHTMVDGALFEQEVAAHSIRAVPTALLNGKVFGQGRMDVDQIVAKLDKGSAQRLTSKMNAEAPYDVLIVGGGPAGAAAAIYAARKGIRVAIAAERFGGQVLDTMGIENLIALKETEGPALARGLEENVRANGVPIFNLQRATKLVPGQLNELRFDSGASLKAKSVVIATGARWRNLNVPGEKEYLNKGVAYCPHCDGPLFKGKDVAVVGGGNSGVEAAIDLAGVVNHVTLLEFGEQLRADAVLIAKLNSLPNVTIITNAETTSVQGDGQQVTALTYKDRVSGDKHNLALNGIFVQIGLVPNTDWLEGVVKLSVRGEIEVDARAQTSILGVYAAGDCTTVPFKQIVVAMGEGSKAALGAFDHLIRTPVIAQAA